MSAPTRQGLKLITVTTEAGSPKGARPATAADVRLWLLSNGAEEHQWCETHDQTARDGDAICLDAELDDRSWHGCVVVSVLVWRGEVT